MVPFVHQSFSPSSTQWLPSALRPRIAAGNDASGFRSRRASREAWLRMRMLSAVTPAPGVEEERVWSVVPRAETSTSVSSP